LLANSKGKPHIFPGNNGAADAAELAIMLPAVIKLLERDRKIDDVCRKGSALRIGAPSLPEIEKNR
jgi:hypothetical protein